MFVVGGVEQVREKGGSSGGNACKCACAGVKCVYTCVDLRACSNDVRNGVH